MQLLFAVAVAALLFAAANAFVGMPPQVMIGFLFTIVFTFPMSNFAMRICIHHLLHGETDTTPIQHVLETVLPFAVVTAGALFVTDLGVVYSLLGSVRSTAIVLLFPAAMYLKSPAIKQRSPHMQTAAKAVFAFGWMFLVFGVISSIIKALAAKA